MAREWRCKWSEENEKKSLVLCQQVMAEVVIPQLRNTIGVLSVQRVVCGGNKDFKIIVKMGLDSFNDWAAHNFSPENEVVEALLSVEGVSEIAAQTWALSPVIGPGRLRASRLRDAAGLLRPTTSPADGSVSVMADVLR